MRTHQPVAQRSAPFPSADAFVISWRPVHSWKNSLNRPSETLSACDSLVRERRICYPNQQEGTKEQMSERTTRAPYRGVGNAVLAGRPGAPSPLIDTYREARTKGFPLRIALVYSLVALGATSASGQDARAKNYEPASVRALPGLNCSVYATGTTSAKGVPVFSDDDGCERKCCSESEPLGVPDGFCMLSW